MATLEEQHYSTEYTGLISTASLCLGFIGVMTISFETFSRLPRNVARKKRPGFENEPPSVENYVMAYLYRPRAFLGKNRGPQIPRWPLAWFWQVWKLPQSWYLRHSGLDSAVYVRFVTGCWYFMLSQLLTTLLVLLPLHISYAPDSVLPSSIAQASVSSLIDSTTGGRGYLWTHTVLLWWQSISWIITLVWVGWGNIRMRKEQILEPYIDAKDEQKDEEAALTAVEGIPAGLDPRGWRFRTVKVSNIPLHMRSEQALKSYFDSCLAYMKRHPGTKFYDPTLPSNGSIRLKSPSLSATARNSLDGGQALVPSVVDHVVIVRKLTELHQLVDKRKTVLHELESAHVILAKNIMAAIASQIRLKADEPNLKERLLRKEEDPSDQLLNSLTDNLAQFLPKDSKEARIWESWQSEKQSVFPDRCIWEVLADFPPKSLDQFQPVVKLKIFHGQVAPSIDYYLTKLNLLTSLIEDLRAKPDSYAACDSAFVTFKAASDARLAKRELSWIRARGLTCRVRMAPDTRDLDWNKLVQANFRGDVLRSFVVHALVWAATIVWIIPMGALVGLVSIDNLSTRIPRLARWLDNHARAKSLFSSLLPTLIVTIVNMLVPTIMIQVSGRGQTFVTLSKLHHATWCRYWKWLIINVVIAFCAGTALFTSLLGIFSGDSFEDQADNPLNVIASSFSNGAVFFVSYTILIIGTQCFFEAAQFMIPWFLFLGARKATSPRQRLAKTEPRRFFAYTVGPNHTLVISVILVFSLLNPLPICFVFIYFSFAYFIFKDHFARLYWRVYYEGNGRLFYMRIMRYSLDALVLGQVVTMALFFVLKTAKNGAACAALIPITVITKLVLTRWYDTHMDAADATFADVLTGALTLQKGDNETLDDRNDLAARQKNRNIISRRIGSLALPELSLWETIKLPLQARKHLKTDKGPQGAIHRLAQRLQNSGPYAEIKDSVDARRDANLASAQILAAPSAERTLQVLENPESENSRVLEKAPVDQHKQYTGPMVLPHPRLKRDDRPDYSAAYADPYLSEPLHVNLWLPRDPLHPIDLDDTIDWHGRALVSSEGGAGTIGAWNPESTATDLTSVHEDQNAQEIIVCTTPEPLLPSTIVDGLSASPLSHRTRTISLSANTGSPRRVSRPLGTERIQVADDIAIREEADQLQHGSLSSNRTSGTEVSSSGTLLVPPVIRRLSSSLSSKRRIESQPDRARFQRSPSVGNMMGSTPESLPSAHLLTTPPPCLQDLRRVQSEIVDPVERNLVRMHTPIPMTAPIEKVRHRSHSGVSRGSGASGLISQTRALAHEVLQEERKEAVARRKEEDKKMLSRISNAGKSWRNWFLRAPEDAD